MTTIVENAFAINGVISTDKTILQNLNTLCSAAGAWLTYDVVDGKWSVIINQSGSSVASFDDSNIIGGITISGTGLSELYNAVSVEYPNKDLRDETDYVDININQSEWYPNEVPNTLNIQYESVNNQAQAQLLGAIELKQSRKNLIVRFRTDFSKMGLKAGDIIDITESLYGFTNKLFRIITIEENDDEELSLSITGLEYDADVYSTSGISISTRTRKTGIILASQNEEIQKSNDIDTGNAMLRLLAANLAAGLLKKLFNKIFDQSGNPAGVIGPTEQTAKDIDKLLGAARKPPVTAITGTNSLCRPGLINLTIRADCTSCLFEIPDFEYDYIITGVDASEIDVPLNGKITIQNQQATFPITVNQLAGVSGGSKTLTFTVGDISKNVILYNKLNYTYVTTASPTSITEGASSTVTLTTTNVPDGTVIPYVISGSGTGRVSTALTGNVTVTGNQATLSVATIDDGTYTGTQSVTVTFNSAQADNCNELDKTAAISILDNDTPPPANTNCEFVTVPVVWCGIFNGSDNQLTGLTASKSMTFYKPLAGEASTTVPLTVSVTKGNPSTIAVTSTATVASGSNLAGISVKVITSFDAVPPKGLITGTTTTITGY